MSKKESKDVLQELPDRLMRVRCYLKSNPSMTMGAHYHYFDPKDQTFRTKKWKNVTNRVARWIEV